MARPVFQTLTLLLFVFFLAVEGRLIVSRSADLVSDGSDGRSHARYPFLLRSPVRAESSCDQTYGFLPCTTTVLGNLFLVIVYGYSMFLGATYLSHGSELLLQILGPGIVGGLFLPVLGALPDAILILVSGISGSKETAQEQVSIGMGLLAGSTVMLLTILWGSCVVVGKCDLSERSTAIDGQDTRKCSLSGSGITTDKATSTASRIMVLSVIPFIIVQLPQIFNHTSWDSTAILVALIFALMLLVSYCLYQVFEPWIQKRRFAYAKHKHVIAGFLKHMNMKVFGKLIDSNGEPSKHDMQKAFKLVDADHDGLISPLELRAFVIGITFEDIDLDKQQAANKIMAEFDTSGDNQLNEEEFSKGISTWLLLARKEVPLVHHTGRLFDIFHQNTVNDLSLIKEGSDETMEHIEDSSKVWMKAVMLLILGTVIAAIFADPLVDAVDNFSSATSIPSFFISFIAMPLATNSSEAVSALLFASRKKQRTASLTFSEIYGAVTMNNLLCLAVFLALVSIRGLTWDFSAEVVVILVVVILMGIFTSFRTTFPIWTSSIAYLFYPLSLVLVYVLDYVLGWS